MLALLTLGLGVHAGLDAASHASGRSKARTVAAALAQEDQERMRALRITDLANHSTSSTRTVDGVPFTIRSEANYVQDSSGAAACSSSARADYLAIVSTVTWPDIGAGKPMQLQSIVAPPTGSFSPTQGSVAVTVRDRNGLGVPGVGVTLVGAASYSQTTNADGCALFAYITPGTWTLEADTAGYVDVDGRQAVTRTVSVTAATTTVTAFDYDRSASTVVTFDTVRPSSGVGQPARAEAVTVAHPTLSAPGTRVFPLGAPSGEADYESISVTSMFPFTSSYGFYSGTCTANDPASYDPPRPGAYLVAGSGGTHAIVVREPALDIRVTAGGVPREGARVVFTSADSGCGNRFVRTTNVAGQIDEPGLPYGTYTVCADWEGRRVTSTGVENLAPEGVSLALPDLVGGSSQSGTCP